MMNLTRTSSFITKFAVYLLFACLTTVAAAPHASAEVKHQTTQTELYNSRPKIHTVSPNKAPQSSQQTRLINAHIALAAELLEAYPPDTHFYFLARDAEYLYDIAHLATEGTPAEKQIHLLNISRLNMHSDQLLRYLSQNGISEETLLHGHKVVFVDTGFSGTIPQKISESFSPEAAEHLKTHLVVSANPQHPSSRFFISFLNPLVNHQAPSQLHSTIVQYEHMPRFTDRSHEFAEQADGILTPESYTNHGASDGLVSRERAIEFMGHLRERWEQGGKKQFEADRARVKMVRDHLRNGDTKELKALVSDETTEALIRDLIEAERNTGDTFQVRLDDLDLLEHDLAESPQKFQLIQKHPEWTEYLTDPVVGIPKLFVQGNWPLISTFLDANIDSEMNVITYKLLFSKRAKGMQRALQIATLENPETPDVTMMISEIDDSPANNEALFMLDIIKHLHPHNSKFLGDLMARRERLTNTTMRTEFLKHLDITMLDRFTKSYSYSKPPLPGEDEALLEVLKKIPSETVMHELMYKIMRNLGRIDGRESVRYVFEHYPTYFSDRLVKDAAGMDMKASKDLPLLMASLRLPPQKRAEFLSQIFVNSCRDLFAH